MGRVDQQAIRLAEYRQDHSFQELFSLMLRFGFLDHMQSLHLLSL